MGLFIFVNLFALSAQYNVSYSVNSIYTTEKRILNQDEIKVHKIFYKSFIEKNRPAYFNPSLLRDAFENILIFKNRMVHIAFNANSLLVLLINFLIGTSAARIFLFHMESQKTSLPA
ncbi:hypothetical protein CPT03_09970 [Pedobacter ginsengisoli]|uniref:Uncharacterized protein n=2 Tax=Pedobacter ginsengisoli TaxID=363852 RepID=A0A2D1U5B9_9SPHI|nr:hypothetical protein CPT03_09970 [Pedobacter ginsengisoli]